MITIIQCGIADRDHEDSIRQYAHTMHYKNTICIAGEWRGLPINFQMGVIAHEVGHLLFGSTDHTEQDADKAANKFFDIKIKYKDSSHGKRLQWLSLNDTMNVWEWTSSNTIMY
jgi:hypothetical protein